MMFGDSAGMMLEMDVSSPDSKVSKVVHLSILLA